jgi:membrane fusion protein, multidrug efflux system
MNSRREKRLAAGLLGLLAFALFGCQVAEPVSAADRPAASAIAVRLHKVDRAALARPIHAAGTLQLKSESDLSFKLPGVVTRVAVDAGSRVRKGQLLAAIDPTEADAASSQSAETLAKAERDLQRVHGLFASGALGQVELQNAETSVVMARANAATAQFNQRHVSLVAPDDGVVERRSVEVGEMVAPGRVLFHLRGLSRGMVVRTNVSDRDLLDLHHGDLARVSLDARPNAVLSAHVTQIASSASPGTGTFEVELLLDDPPAAQLPSGLTAKIEIARNEQALANVPLAALVDGQGDSAAVYVVEGDRAKRVPVRVSFLLDDRVALASGLDQVDSVIDLGAAQLSDGARVRVVQ